MISPLTLHYRRPTRSVSLTIDGHAVSVPEGTMILDAARVLGIDTPTLCFLQTLTPVNACRVCVVEVEGARTLAPACARPVEDGMVVHTDSERVRHSRRLVMELLDSSVNLDYAPDAQRYLGEYEADSNRFGPPAPSDLSGDRDHAYAGHHNVPVDGYAATVTQPTKIDNGLYVRDYSRCILCYKCVEACGEDAQNTFAITTAGRGFDARISTEFDTPLPDSACVYCGNCIGVCPTGALMFTTEFEMRQNGTWDERQQTVTDTICPYCGVGCTLQLHVQDNSIVKVTSPMDHDVTFGHLCIKGRFGWQYTQNHYKDPDTVAGQGDD